MGICFSVFARRLCGSTRRSIVPQPHLHSPTTSTCSACAFSSWCPGNSAESKKSSKAFSSSCRGRFTGIMVIASPSKYRNPSGSIFADCTAPGGVSQRNLFFPYFLNSIHPCFFALPETAAPFPQRWGLLRKRACRLQERRSFQGKTQMPGGGGGASSAPLNFCLCIPCLPGPPCVTV
jgi:hypothetical protein